MLQLRRSECQVVNDKESDVCERQVTLSVFASGGQVFSEVISPTVHEAGQSGIRCEPTAGVLYGYVETSCDYSPRPVRLFVSVIFL